jgi:hypothetical protein
LATPLALVPLPGLLFFSSNPPDSPTYEWWAKNDNDEYGSIKIEPVNMTDLVGAHINQHQDNHPH